jgi:hypothetical protein
MNTQNTQNQEVMNKHEVLNDKLHNERLDNLNKVDTNGKSYNDEFSFTMIRKIINADLPTKKENVQLKKALQVAKVEMKIQDLQNKLEQLLNK